jgi:anti-anti-sigma regulatory factor
MASNLPGKSEPPDRDRLASVKSAQAAAAPLAAFSTDQISPDSNTFPPIYEAAILFAADCYPAAHETLKEYMKLPDGKNSIRTWLMLFDFYQLTHDRKEFDALSMLFTVKFERSPPLWAEESGSSDPRRKEKRERKDLFVIKPNADGALLEQIDLFETFAQEIHSSRVDFSKVQSILSEEAELLSIVLHRLRRVRIPLWFNSLDEFVGLLKKSINDESGKTANAAMGYWSLLFELYILDGRLNEYEDLGLEYAVAFEMSPPAWENVVRPGGGAAVQAAVLTDSADRGQVGFPLKGVINSGSKEMLQQLALYAASKQEVVVDMSGLMRIDFNAINLFFEAIRAIHLAQKRVILSNLNEMVAAILEVFGMTKHAILMRKKAA